MEKEGSVVTPPSFGIHEALLPEELAASLQIDDFVHLSFDPEQAATPDGPLRLSVNHPLVETIAHGHEAALHFVWGHFLPGDEGDLFFAEVQGD